MTFTNELHTDSTRDERYALAKMRAYEFLMDVGFPADKHTVACLAQVYLDGHVAGYSEGLAKGLDEGKRIYGRDVRAEMMTMPPEGE